MDIGIFGIYNELGLPAAAAFLFWGIFSITMHELAHGWAALSQGDDTPRIYGRMTANPVVHMGWMSLILLVLTGIAWGMMPTDPSKYRWGRRGRIIVSGAGPAMNVLLWAICWGGLGLLAAKELEAEGSLFQAIRVVAGFSRTYYRWMHDPRVANAGFFIVLVAMFSGVGGVMGRWADRVGADLALSIARLVA